MRTEGRQTATDDRTNGGESAQLKFRGVGKDEAQVRQTRADGDNQGPGRRRRREDANQILTLTHVNVLIGRFQAGTVKQTGFLWAVNAKCN